MALLDQVTSGRQSMPRRTVLYGVHGIGKSTWCSMWPDPVFIKTEDGVSDLEVSSFPLAKDPMQVWQALIELADTSAHKFKTIVLDSADWLERLIWQDICQEKNKTAITDFDYGKGYGLATQRFRQILEALNNCRDAGLHVVVIAHCEIKRFENPEGASYDRYTPKLHKDCSAILQEWADEVLFATYKVAVRSNDEGFGKERGIGIGTGERVLKTTERPGYLAKNRLSLPEELPLDFEEYKPFLSA